QQRRAGLFVALTHYALGGQRSPGRRRARNAPRRRLRTGTRATSPRTGWIRAAATAATTAAAVRRRLGRARTRTCTNPPAWLRVWRWRWGKGGGGRGAS